MRKTGFCEPPYFLRRRLLVIIVLVFASCAAPQTNNTAPPSQSAGQVRTGEIVFRNRTPFTVHLVRGSGRIDVATLAPSESVRVTNTFDTAETYYPLFDIPLISSWSLQRIRPDDRDYYFQIDNFAAYQEIDITLPRNFSDNSAYIIFINNSRSGGAEVSRNDSANRMTGINFPAAKSNVNAGETIVFRENPSDIQSLRLNPSNITFGKIEYRSGYVYKFIFDGNEVLQIDARPLAEVGSGAPLAVEFSGDVLSEAEKQELTGALNTALRSGDVPLRIIAPGEEAAREGRIFYTMRINVRIQTLPPQPPVNREMLKGDLTLTILQSGRELRTVRSDDIREMFRANLMRNISDQLKNQADFFQVIKANMFL